LACISINKSRGHDGKFIPRCPLLNPVSEKVILGG
jgi:hypothetical protein